MLQDPSLHAITIMQIIQITNPPIRKTSVKTVAMVFNSIKVLLSQSEPNAPPTAAIAI